MNMIKVIFGFLLFSASVGCFGEISVTASRKYVDERTELKPVKDASHNVIGYNLGIQTNITLISNIKTVNGNSLLGPGNIEIQGGGGGGGASDRITNATSIIKASGEWLTKTNATLWATNYLCTVANAQAKADAAQAAAIADAAENYLPLAGGTMTGDIYFNGRFADFSEGSHGFTIWNRHITVNGTDPDTNYYFDDGSQALGEDQVVASREWVTNSTALPEAFPIITNAYTKTEADDRYLGATATASFANGSSVLSPYKYPAGSYGKIAFSDKDGKTDVPYVRYRNGVTMDSVDSYLIPDGTAFATLSAVRNTASAVVTNHVTSGYLCTASEAAYRTNTLQYVQSGENKKFVLNSDVSFGTDHPKKERIVKFDFVTGVEFLDDFYQISRLKQNKKQYLPNYLAALDWIPAQSNYTASSYHITNVYSKTEINDSFALKTNAIQYAEIATNLKERTSYPNSEIGFGTKPGTYRHGDAYVRSRLDISWPYFTSWLIPDGSDFFTEKQTSNYVEKVVGSVNYGYYNSNVTYKVGQGVVREDSETSNTNVYICIYKTGPGAFETNHWANLGTQPLQDVSSRVVKMETSKQEALATITPAPMMTAAGQRLLSAAPTVAMVTNAISPTVATSVTSASTDAQLATAKATHDAVQSASITNAGAVAVATELNNATAGTVDALCATQSTVVASLDVLAEILPYDAEKGMFDIDVSHATQSQHATCAGSITNDDTEIKAVYVIPAPGRPAIGPQIDFYDKKNELHSFLLPDGTPVLTANIATNAFPIVTNAYTRAAADARYAPTSTAVTVASHATQLSQLSQSLAGKADAADLATKQPTLVSGVNIKTVNSASLLGEGDISITAADANAVHYAADKGGNLTALTIGSRNAGAVGISSTVHGLQSVASGDYTHAEGQRTKATGQYAHAEGLDNEASGYWSHAEGRSTKASKTASHAEGQGTKASGDYAHAEGCYAEASGLYSHAEGGYTVATNSYAHAEGASSRAYGLASHAGGKSATAEHDYSYAWNGVTTDNHYKSKGVGTYCVRPNGGADGFFVGDDSLSALITNYASAYAGGKMLIGKKVWIFGDSLMAGGQFADHFRTISAADVETFAQGGSTTTPRPGNLRTEWGSGHDRILKAISNQVASATKAPDIVIYENANEMGVATGTVTNQPWFLARYVDHDGGYADLAAAKQGFADRFSSIVAGVASADRVRGTIIRIPYGVAHGTYNQRDYYFRYFMGWSAGQFTDVANWSETQPTTYASYKGVVEKLMTTYPRARIVVLNIPLMTAYFGDERASNPAWYFYPDGSWNVAGARQEGRRKTEDTWGAFLKDVADLYGIGYIDVPKSVSINLVNLDTWYNSNDVHPKVEAYSRWAEVVYERILGGD